MSQAANRTASNLDLVELSQVYLWDRALGQPLVALGADNLAQPPSLLLTLIRCRTVFDGTDLLYEALCANRWSRAAWLGRRSSIRKVYSRLRIALEWTTYPLCIEGFYGFYLRATREQRAAMDRRALQRAMRAKRTRSRKREEARDFGSVRPLC